MIDSSRPSIQIALNEFKLHIHFKSRNRLTLHFNSPSRKFYLSLIALVVKEMKKSGKLKSIPMAEHLDLLGLLNETIGGAAGSSDKGNLLHRIYTKWRDTLPNLEEAPLFKVLGRKKEEDDGGKAYSFGDLEKDGWANLFEYVGSEENVRLKFAVDKIGISLDETSIIFGDSVNAEAWERFISSLKKDGNEEIEVASIGRMKYPLPEIPSIAVLPFVNMSEDPKQEFLCDGMTEAIITALSKAPRLFVIARSSTFTYKGKVVKVKQVSEELGVRYVLEGSVQRSADRIRITAQLIDALTGNHIWAERYDRDLIDIFALQDEITMKILTATQVKLTVVGQESLEKHFKGKQGLDCYLKLLEGFNYLERNTIEDTNLARRIAEEVIGICPDVPMAYMLMSNVHLIDYWLGSTRSPRESIEKGIELAQKSLSLVIWVVSIPQKGSMTRRLRRENELWPSTPVGPLALPPMP
jgi:TolB-like protein